MKTMRSSRSNLSGPALLLLGAVLAWPGTSRSARAAGSESPDDPGVQLEIRKVLHEAKTTKEEKPGALRRGPQVQLYFRRYEFTCTDGPCWYEHLGLMLYPSAWIEFPGWWRLLRLGVGLAGAWEHSQERTKYWQHNFTFEFLFVLGLHYPARVTPYAQLILGLGGMHRNIYNKDFVDFTYSFGLDAGAELFMVGPWHITASIGWRRSIVDIGPQSLFADSFTFQVGMGF